MSLIKKEKKILNRNCINVLGILKLRYFVILTEKVRRILEHVRSERESRSHMELRAILFNCTNFERYYSNFACPCAIVSNHSRLKYTRFRPCAYNTSILRWNSRKPEHSRKVGRVFVGGTRQRIAADDIDAQASDRDQMAPSVTII